MKPKSVNGKLAGDGLLTLQEAARALGMAPLELRGALKALGIVPKAGRSRNNRLALLIDIDKLRAAMKAQGG